MDVGYHVRSTIIKVQDPRRITPEQIEEMINDASATLLTELKRDIPQGFEIVSHSISQLFGNICVSYLVKFVKRG